MKVSLPSKLYRWLISVGDRTLSPSLQQRIKWNHPAGPKTIFFWSPVMKTGLVIAGLSDYTRPPEKLSTYQSTALFATGAIWSRYSLIIIPKNWFLFLVNFSLGCTGLVQLGRIGLYNYEMSEKEKLET
ncbi:hypothetical protein SNEBB_007087 [Seison nebaliae]|nr:hypothetical protein SNEBB_007087 [Seison nebaliae]